MKVKINSVRKTVSHLHVTFSTAIGTGAATWKDGIPAAGEKWEVELEIKDEFVYGENAKDANESYSLSMKKDVINLNAQLISITEDGTAIIDINGTKVMIDLIGCPSNPPRFIYLSFKGLNLYPVHL
ncbi:hypothetical protein [Pseudomonas sp. D1-1]|uniref:hypothetical protein n=1 Tax=Pseudomonas sp. D1-1 TaxID=1040793 RepID=UPI003DA9B5AA